MISLRRTGVRALCAALALVPLFCASTYAEPRLTLPQTHYAASPQHKSVAIRTKATPKTTAAYTVVDDGAPSGGLSLGESVAINNTGQIVGLGYDSVANSQYCVLFDGKEYLNLSAWVTFTTCAVNGINDEATATGSLDVVGFGTTIYSGSDQKAVLFNVTPKTGVIRTEISPDDSSVLTGVVDSGEAVGFGPYSPSTGFAAENAPLFVAPGKTSLAVLQPSCTTVGPGCGAPIINFNQDPDYAVCGFGGCQIAADGTLLLLDIFTGAYELVSPTGKTTDVVLDADVTSIPLLNNQKQLVYSFTTLVAGVETTQSALYNIVTAKAVTLPPIPNYGCALYTPISFNNVGQVLGIATACPNRPQIYYIYDPAIGTHDLATEIPAGYFSVDPHAVNDLGDILVDFQKTSGGPTHWGYLKPVSAKITKQRPVDFFAAAGKQHQIDRTVALANAAARLRHYRTTERSSIPKPRTRLAETKPGPVHLGSNAVRVSSASYTIVDDGAPASSSFLLEIPTAFNDNGQIVGIGHYVPYTQSVACVIFDGSRFRDLKGSTTMVDCNPDAISDENPATGAFSVVGAAASAFSIINGAGFTSEDWDDKAFISRVAPKSGALATTLFAANDNSTLIGVNASGLAIGGAEYFDRTSGENTSPAFVLSPGSNTLSLLQPSCALGAGCVDVYPNTFQQCPFGGCTITANGSIFLSDVLIAPNGSTQVIKLDSNADSIQINNSNQIMYRDGQHTEIYKIGTGTLTSVPQIPGSSCQVVAPLSFNDAGTVLGYTSSCTKATDYTYFIYDPKNGTRNLIAELPSGNASVTPVGINNNGQILVGLTLPSGIVHWGVLNPVTAQEPKYRPTSRFMSRI